jgi:zinc protease
MTRRCGPFVAALVVLAALIPAGASSPSVSFTERTLDNGLRVLIAEDHTAPVFSIAVTYNAGSRDEQKGHTGIAHLFEHMMFRGSNQVGAGEHFALVFGNGGNMNGTTSQDRTVFFETLAANQLDLALFLEADRMSSLDVTEEMLKNQRNAVHEERRLGVDNQPYGRTFEVLSALIYQNFAYAHSFIGSPADLDAATLADLKSFYKTYYAPNNAVLSIVGDVATGTCLLKIRKYFDRIPSQPPPPQVDMTEPPQTSERRTTIEDPLARLPRIDIAWHAPPSNTPDDDALTVLSTVLAGGRTSRFYESLVKQRELTTGVNATSATTRGPGVFQVSATALPGKSIAELEKGIYAEIEKVRTGPIAAWELDKARKTQKRALVSNLTSSLQRAISLGQFALFWNDPNLINTYVDRIANVTTGDLQRVAKAHLTQANRSVVITQPRNTGGSRAGSREP